MEAGRQLVLGESIQEYVDGHSNRWWLSNSGTVHLKLASEEKSRKIGQVVDNRFVVTRNREKHLYRITESYGFSSEILKGLRVEYIDLTEDTGTFRIPINIILEKGEYIFFKKQGFEKQLFLPIREIFPYRIVFEADLKRIKLMGESWYKRLKPEFEKPYMQELAQRVSQRRLEWNVYPTKEDVFNAFKYCPFEKVKVIAMAQDPYHTADVADGLAFSSGIGWYLPPSLQKIYQAVEKEMHLGLMLDQNPSLKYWAEQGVLLINTILTVEQGKPKSHAGWGWEQFVKAALLELKNSGRAYVGLLWGKDAQGFREFIENDNSLILEAEHPVYAARMMRDWDNKECFKKTNQFLTQRGLGAIEW